MAQAENYVAESGIESLILSEVDQKPPDTQTEYTVCTAGGHTVGNGYPAGNGHSADLPEATSDGETVISGRLRLQQLQWEQFFNPRSDSHTPTGISKPCRKDGQSSTPNSHNMTVSTNETSHSRSFPSSDYFADFSDLVTNEQAAFPNNVKAGAAMRIRHSGPLWVVYHGDGVNEVEHRFDFKIIWQLDKAEKFPKRNRE